jgi:DNA-binding CsgD family transcriptional regulator
VLSFHGPVGASGARPQHMRLRMNTYLAALAGHKSDRTSLALRKSSVSQSCASKHAGTSSGGHEAGAGVASGVDAEQLLVVRGWHSLHCCCVGRFQRVTIVPADAPTASARLTPLDFRLLRLMGRGLASKEIAAELQLRTAAVRALARRVIHKLGLRTPAQLPAFWQATSGTGRWVELDAGRVVVFEVAAFEGLEGNLDAGVQVALSPAERAIAGHILEGLTNARIAEKRSTSVRTIANQVASLFRKLGVMSRTELVAKIMQASAREIAESSRPKAANVEDSQRVGH